MPPAADRHRLGAQVLLGGSTHLIALLVLGANSSALVEAGETWRLITANLLHLGPIRLVVNLVALHYLARRASPSLGLPGGLVVFGLSALAGAWLSAAVGAPSIAVGASGGILGLLGAECAAHYKGYGRHTSGAPPLTHFLRQAGWVLLISLLPGIDFLGHLAGFAAGALIGMCLADSGRPDSGRGGKGRRAIRRKAVLILAVLVTFPYVIGAGWMAKRAFGDEVRFDDPRWLAVGIPELTNGIAWSMAWDRRTSQDQLDQARDAMLDIVAEKRDPAWLDTLAAVEFRAGERETAFSLQREAASTADLSPLYCGRLLAYQATLEGPSDEGAGRDTWAVLKRDELARVELSFLEDPAREDYDTFEEEMMTWLAYSNESGPGPQPVFVVHCQIGPGRLRLGALPVTHNEAPGDLAIPDGGVSLRLEPRTLHPSLGDSVAEDACGLWALPSSAGIAEVSDSTY